MLNCGPDQPCYTDTCCGTTVSSKQGTDNHGLDIDVSVVGEDSNIENQSSDAAEQRQNPPQESMIDMEHASSNIKNTSSHPSEELSFKELPSSGVSLEKVQSLQASENKADLGDKDEFVVIKL